MKYGEVSVVGETPQPDGEAGGRKSGRGSAQYRGCFLPGVKKEGVVVSFAFL